MNVFLFIKLNNMILLDFSWSVSSHLQQKLELVQLPERSYGNFYEGDCYVLLSVSVRR